MTIAKNTIPISIDGKIQPQDVPLEEAVLGAMMLEREHLETISDILKSEMFYKPSHQSIYRAITDLYAKNEPVDLLTVTAKLKQNGELEIAGGAYYISQLTNRVASSANTEYHARKIQEHYIKRDLIRLSAQTINEAYDEEADFDDLITKHEIELGKLTENIGSDNVLTAYDLQVKAIAHNEKILALKGGLSGTSTGFKRLDDLTGGWQKTCLVVVAARPSMGKSALALDFMLAAAIKGEPVALFSLEVSNERVYSRIQAKVSGIDLSKITQTGLNEGDMRSMNLACQWLNNAPLYFEDVSSLNIGQLKRKARNLYRKKNVRIFIIDYLQLLTGNEKGNREQEIASIMRGLKILSKELDATIIALSQLSREVEKSADKKPNLSHLRESGSIEQDADVVMFIYRPEYYDILQDETGKSLVGKAKIIIAKNKDGALGDVNLDWIGRITKFKSEDLEVSRPLEPNTEFTKGEF